MTKNTLSFAFVAGLVMVGAAYKPAPLKTFPVIHTEAEWARNINALSYVSGHIRQSDVPANIAFTCDSILQSQILDINRQVVAAMQADTTTKKK